MDGRYWAVPVGGVRVNLPLFHGALYVFWVCFMQLFHCRASLLFLAFFSGVLLRWNIFIFALDCRFRG